MRCGSLSHTNSFTPVALNKSIQVLNSWTVCGSVRSAVIAIQQHPYPKQTNSFVFLKSAPFNYSESFREACATKSNIKIFEILPVKIKGKTKPIRSATRANHRQQPSVKRKAIIFLKYNNQNTKCLCTAQCVSVCVCVCAYTVPECASLSVCVCVRECLCVYLSAFGGCAAANTKSLETNCCWRCVSLAAVGSMNWFWPKFDEENGEQMFFTFCRV